MGFLDRFTRAESLEQDKNPDITGTMTEDSLVTALIGSDRIGKDEVLSIPEVQYCIETLGGTIAGLPIRLYEKDGKKEIKDDIRTYLLNVDTKDTLTASQFWKIMLEDYFLGSHGGFGYINKKRNSFVSLHHIEENRISCFMNTDPIFKDYTVNIQGKKYFPFEFVKIMRKTEDGCHNKTLTDEANLMLSVAYFCFKYQDKLLRKGGGKKGFVKSQKKLSDQAMTALKSAFRSLYSDTDESVVVLNDGLDFQESSNTSVEMELADNIKNNGVSVCRLFGLDTSSKESFEATYIKAISRIIQDIETSLNRDFLLEKEKDSLYFAFDTRELTRGDLKERYDAYKEAIASNWLQIDEVRELEDLEPLGINWITLGLDQVLYNPTTGEVYTPNTKEKAQLNISTEEGGEE